jgi:hypothetical protein
MPLVKKKYWMPYVPKTILKKRKVLKIGYSDCIHFKHIYNNTLNLCTKKQKTKKALLI